MFIKNKYGYKVDFFGIEFFFLKKLFKDILYIILDM